MAGMSGDMLIEEAKKQNLLTNTYIIVITGSVLSGYTEEQRQALRDEADGYIQKPFSRETIYRTLKNLGKAR